MSHPHLYEVLLTSIMKLIDAANSILLSQSPALYDQLTRLHAVNISLLCLGEYPQFMFDADNLNEEFDFLPYSFTQGHFKA